MRRVFSAAVAALAVIVAAPAAAATPIIDSGPPILTGATGVNVDGTLYDVTFADGTCASIFASDGCQQSNFAFTDQATALLAAQALLDQVYIFFPGLSPYSYGVQTNLIAGCTDPFLCETFIPYATASGNVSTSVALNYTPSQSNDSVGSTAFGINALDTRNYGQANWAIFTQVSAGLPEPATWAMMLLGFAAIGFQLRRKGGQKTNHLAELA